MWNAPGGPVILLSFRLRRPGSLGSVTTRHSKTRLHTWCNLETDFVHVVGPDREQTRHAMQTILQRFGPSVMPGPTGAGDGNVALVQCPAKRKTSVSRLVERHGGFVQAPIVSEQGWDLFRVLLFADEAAADLLGAVSRLGECELVSKKPVRTPAPIEFFVPASELLGSVTRRQAEALLAAANAGYYEEPRATTLGQIAQRIQWGRANLEEHLRKAENKLLKALVPFVSVQAAGLAPSRPRGRPFARNNRHQVQPPRAVARARAGSTHAR